MKFKRVASVGTLLSLAGCAHHYRASAIADPYGFFSGIWHGLISPFTTIFNIVLWIASFFDSELVCNIEIIGQPNTGVFYFVGFAVGVLVYLGLAD